LRDLRTLHHPFEQFVKGNRDYFGVDPWPETNMSQAGSWAPPWRKIRLPDKAQNRSV